MQKKTNALVQRVSKISLVKIMAKAQEEDIMKCIKIIVPRMLIKHHKPHPEPYGESIVELLNDMVTDVYTDDTNNLVTETNNTKLIEYLKDNYTQDKRYVLNDNGIKLSSIKPSDLKTVLTWMNQKTNYSYNVLTYKDEDIKLFFSHAISSRSHLFMIKKDNISIGIAGYDVIDQKGIIDLKIYDKEMLFDHNQTTPLSLLMNHMFKAYQVTDFCTHILKDDHYSHHLFIKNNFIKDHDHALELPALESSVQKAYMYHNKFTHTKVTEGEKEILNTFFQLYPKKLYDLANSDELIDLEHAIDYSLKIYISLILTNQLYHKDEFDGIYIDEEGLLIIEDNLIQKYDEMKFLLSGEDLRIAVAYKALILPVLDIINRYIKAYEEKELYYKTIK